MQLKRPDTFSDKLRAESTTKAETAKHIYAFRVAETVGREKKEPEEKSISQY